ncbi:hypothetical protein BSL78_23018 [Apostichopus japonicus]|uniref:medium-chain acyl-CoA ligase n=1 Tax=Stichopus japonicus TaxID=307972 RepID=A0A2G8JWM7_STIJA|nr:hypothetical protein BSL78_23018 [Apostichopus japonicus]
MWSFKLRPGFDPVMLPMQKSISRKLQSFQTCQRHCLLLQRKEQHLSQRTKRGFLSAVSATGFNDYELERKRFKWDVPKYYNFANVTDHWAEKEKNGQRASPHPALWWVNDDGTELKYTFQDIQYHSKKIANMLITDCELQPGDMVMVILPKVPEWWFINIACHRAGLIVTPGTSLLTSGDIKDRLLSSKSKCIIADDKVAEEVDKVAKDCPDLKKKMLVSSKGHSRSSWMDYHESFEKASHLHENVKTLSDDTFLAFFTSGTTGKPKMIEHSHASGSLGHIVTGRYWLDAVPTDAVWCLSDTGWAKAAYGNLYGPWIQGACVFVHHLPAFDPIKVLETLQRYPITVFCAPPTGYRMLVQHDVARYRMNSLRHCLAAGEPTNPEVIEAWQRTTRLRINEGYGQSETTLLIGMFKCLQFQPGSMGKAVPGANVTVVGDDRCTELPPGEEGNIGVALKPRGTAGLFKGYMNDPAMTVDVFSKDYYLTGDRAYKDEDGYFFFVGRDDDVISSAG